MTANVFGSEVIENVLAHLKNEHVITLLRYPDEAITQDVPNLIFFNQDFPENQTISYEFAAGTPMVLMGRVRGKWKPPPCSLTLLKAVGRHYKKIVEYGRKTPSINNRVTFLEQGKLNEYLRAIDTGKDVVASEFCPYYLDLVDGCISVERMSSEIVRTVQLNCRLEVNDWIKTKAYAEENLML